MVVVFANQTTFNQVSASNPTLDGIKIGTPIKAKDGRLAICHPFANENVSELQGKTGVTIQADLPANWEG